MEAQTDIAIIGGGLASLATAAALEGSGLEVTLIRKAPGAAALSNGAWDLCDNPLSYPGEEIDRFPSVGKNISELLHRRPHHPWWSYQQIQGPEAIFSQLQEFTLHLARSIPLELDGDGMNPIALLTDLGTLKATAMVQKSLAAGDLRRMKNAKILVVGIEGFVSLNARFLRKALEEMIGGQENPYVDLVGHLDVRLPKGSSQNSLSAFEVAQSIDSEEVFVELGRQINEYIQGKVYTHIFFPPVLGMIHTGKILEALSKITGCHVAEVLPTLPSVPGWRLAEAILRYFQQQEYDLLAGEVVGYESQGRNIQTLQVHCGKERVKVNAKKVVLATGKFIGGGLRQSPPWHESIFGLPLWIEGKPLEDWDTKALTRDDYEGFQPWRSVGLRVNSWGQPLGIEEDPRFENLYAAGQILSGWDPALDPCNAGVSILSAKVVGQAIRE
ncbi:MAG: FAD-dependent oxidoreductase [bacterium]|nr:FAD-dependent oxidoreductase [bacterium]